MRSNRPTRLALVLWCVVSAGFSLAADPTVSEIEMVQRNDGSGLVDIRYNLWDSDLDEIAVALNVSNDGGLSWIFPCPSVSGDVGPGVISGDSLNIVWDLENDHPGVDSENLMARVVASDAGVEHTTHSPGNYWVTEYSTVDWTDQTYIEKVAKADVFMYNSWDLWAHEENEDLRIVERIKSINPEIKILAYVAAKNTPLRYEGSSHPYKRALYDRTLPYWSYTTTGDTLMDWPGKVVVNILDPDCREAIVGTIAEYAQQSANQVDGIFWDYFNTKIWVAYSVEDQVDGYPDLDGDGIAMADDEDEIQAYKDACDSMIVRMEELMGEDFIQVFNGQRAMSDSTFAALGDGMYYEIFPTLLFPDPDMANALNPDYPSNLFRAMGWPRTNNGGPYNVLGNMRKSYYFDSNGDVQQIYYGDLFRAVGLLTGNYVNWLNEGGNTYSWPNLEISLGEPTLPFERDGAHYWREYEFGRVDLYMGSGAYPNPFSYEIRLNGRIIESLDTPHHYP